MENVLTYGVRVALIFFLTYFGARILTRKTVAQMTAYELAGVILLTTVAAEPLVTKVVTKALFGTGLLIALILFVSYLALNNRLKPILEYNPAAAEKAVGNDLGEADLKTPSQYEGLTLPLVIDKKIVEENLKHVNLTEEWLLRELKNKGVADYKSQISMVALNNQGRLVISWL